MTRSVSAHRGMIEPLEARMLLSSAVLSAAPTLLARTATRPVSRVFAKPAKAIAITPIQAPAAPMQTPVAKNSAVHAHTNVIAKLTSDGLRPDATSSPDALTPAQIRAAYGVGSINFSGITGDGAGQTIAIVDAYDYPTALQDANAFSQHFGLPTFNAGANSPVFQRLNQNGGTSLPNTDPSGAGNAAGTWEEEEALDIEWAHAIAPRANITLYESSNDFDGTSLFTAVQTAARAPGVVAVSMSWGDDENTYGNLSFYDSIFTSPSSHGITFLTASGDNGAYSAETSSISPEYPATSPNVVAVGGTHLTLSGNQYGSESGWGHGTQSGYSTLPSGGGISGAETQPAWQKGRVTQTGSARAYPDISMDADPATGVAVYDSWDFSSSTPWDAVGGTSLASPMWAGLIAIADQGRALAGLKSLDGASQTLPKLYSLSSSDFHDITSGNNGYAAGPGYDLVTGLGTPIANKLVPDLAGLPQQPINNLYVRQDGTMLDEWINSTTPGVGTPTQQMVLADARGLTFTGAAGNDTLTLDYSGGNFASGFSGGITYAGSAGGMNQIAFVGTSGDDTLTATATTITPSGALGGTPITVSNVQAIALAGGSGGNDTLNVNASPAGGYTVNADTATGTPNVAVNVNNSGTHVIFPGTQHIASLSVGDGANATLAMGASSGANVLVTSVLFVSSAGTLDLTNGGMIVNYTGASPLAAIEALIASAYSTGTWSGPGITSSQAANSTYALGYAEASDLQAAGGTFLGQSVGPSAVLVRYTRNGDANLDGIVNFADFAALSQHFGSSSSTWDQGDFNYDGAISFADFILLSGNFGQSA